MELFLFGIVIISSVCNGIGFTLWSYTSLPTAIPYGTSIAVGNYNNELIIVDGHEANEYRIKMLSPPYTTKYHGWASKNILLPGNSTYYHAYSQAAVQIQHLLYMINGLGGISPGQQMFIYDLNTSTFKDYTTYSHKPPTYADECCVVTDQTQFIYVISGGVSATQRYDIINDEWESMAAVNEIRDSAGCAMNLEQTKVFLFGGWPQGGTVTNGGAIKSIEEYSIADNQWNTISAELIYNRHDIHCILSPTTGNIYCVAGRDLGAASTYYTTAEVFNPYTYEINLLTINAGGRDRKLTIVQQETGDYLVVIGGSTGSGTHGTVRSVEELFLSSTSTSVLTSSCSSSLEFKLTDVTLPRPTSSFAGGVHNNTIYLIGGRDDSNDAMNTNIYALDLFYDKSTCRLTTSDTFDILSGITPDAESYHGGNILNFNNQAYNTIDGEIYIAFPRHTISTASNTVMLIFDMEMETFVSADDIASIPVVNSGSCVMTDGANLYVVGGYSSRRQTQIYQPQYDEWITDLSDTNSDRWNSGCAFNKYGTYGYVFGGYVDGEMTYDTIERYNAYQSAAWWRDSSWSNLKYVRLIISRASTQCSVDYVTGYIFCVGGFGRSSYLSSIEIFDPAEERILDHGLSLPVALTNFVFLSYPLSSSRNVLFVFGGINTNEAVDSVYYMILDSSINITIVLDTDTDSDIDTNGYYDDDSDDDNFLAIFLGSFFGGSFFIIFIVGIIWCKCMKNENARGNVGNSGNKNKFGHDVLQDAVHGSGWNHTKPIPSATTAQNTQIPMVINAKNINVNINTNTITAPLSQAQPEVVLVALPDGTMVAAQVVDNVEHVQSVNQPQNDHEGQFDGKCLDNPWE